MSMLVAADFAVALELPALHCAYQARFAHGLDESFGQNNHTVLSSFGAALENGADNYVANLVQSHWPAAELLGNHNQGRRGGFADAQSQMPSGSAHADDNVPTGCGAGVFGQVAEQINPVMPRGLETKGGGRAWKGQIVVNRLGHVGNADGSIGLFVNLAGGKGSVIPANA